MATNFCRRAFDTYRMQDYAQAVNLASQAASLVERGHDLGRLEESFIWDHAQRIILDARRRLDHPNASIFRRIWWVIDGGWVLALGHSTLGGDAEQTSA